jgi:hypothetical protein
MTSSFPSWANSTVFLGRIRSMPGLDLVGHGGPHVAIKAEDGLGRFAVVGVVVFFTYTFHNIGMTISSRRLRVCLSR